MYDWQTEAMTRRKYEINAQMRFYKQEYCGCSYSLRDNNLYRKMHGQPPVRIGGEEAGVGSRYYVDPEADAAEESQEEVRPPATPRPSSMRAHRTRAALAAAAAAAAAAAVHQANLHGLCTEQVDAFFASAVAEIPFDSAKRNVLEGRRRSDWPDAANEKANNW